MLEGQVLAFMDDDGYYPAKRSLRLTNQVFGLSPGCARDRLFVNANRANQACSIQRLEDSLGHQLVHLDPRRVQFLIAEGQPSPSPTR